MSQLFEIHINDLSIDTSTLCCIFDSESTRLTFNINQVGAEKKLWWVVTAAGATYQWLSLSNASISVFGHQMGCSQRIRRLICNLLHPPPDFCAPWTRWYPSSFCYIAFTVSTALDCAWFLHAFKCKTSQSKDLLEDNAMSTASSYWIVWTTPWIQ